MGLLSDGGDLLTGDPRYNTFAGTTPGEFGGGTNKFAGRAPTMGDTVRGYVVNPEPTAKNPFLNVGPGGNARAKMLAEKERQMYKELQDYHWQQQAAKKAHDTKTATEVDQEGFPVNQPYRYDYESAPDWLVGRNIEVPEGSTFKFPSGRFAIESPAEAFYKFRRQFKENPEYDVYTGTYYKDYYPQEWIDMARYAYYEEERA